MEMAELLKAYFQHKQLQFTGDVKEEIQKMNSQSLSGYLYYVYGQPFYNVYVGLTLIQEKYFFLQEELTKLFNQYHIPHMYLKGSVLAKLYPDPALRSRGDIDLIVKKEDYDHADQILQANGYHLCNANIYHHKEYIKNKLMVELHQDLFEKEDLFNSYFDNIFQFAKPDHDDLYLLDHNIHFLYSLCHLNRHLITGEGLRYLLDFYYMQKNWDLNYELLENKMKELKLLTLFKNVNHAIYLITNEQFPLMGEQGQLLIDYMEQKGIHGQIALNPNVQNDFAVSQYAIYHRTKIGYLLDRVFLFNKEERKTLYPRLSKHRIYYPILLVCRFFYLLFCQLPRFFHVLFTRKKRIKKIRDMYEKIGVIKE